MRWLRRAPSPEKAAVDDTVQRLELVRAKRRNALRELVRKLDEIPLDDGLVRVGEDLARTPEGGH